MSRLKTRSLGFSACLLFAACGGQDPSGGDDEGETDDTETGDGETGDTGTDTGDTGTDTGEGLAFEGIETAAWDGADGLTASWSAADTQSPVTYTVFAEAKDGGEQFSFEAGDALEGTVSGLADGEYEMWVEAQIDGVDPDDGDRSLWQLVGDNRVVYRSEVPLVGAADVWGDGDTVAIAGWHSDIGAMLVDTSDVEDPQVLSTIEDIGVVKDVKIHGDLLFTTSECECNPDSQKWMDYEKVGIRIYDVSDPTAPVKLGEIGDPVTSVHNVWWTDGILNVADNVSGNVEIFDVSDPGTPTWIGVWDTPTGRVHDMVTIDDDLYVAFLSGWSVVDVTDPTMPADIALRDYGDTGFVVHTIWPTQDGRHVLVTEEHKGGHVQIFDIEDPNDIKLVSEYQTDPEHMVHNALVRDEFAFISYYWDGLRVVDLSDIENPVEIGWYDTIDEEDVGSGSLFDGAWGIWPYGDHLAVGDQQRGLILLDHVPEVVAVDP